MSTLSPPDQSQLEAHAKAISDFPVDPNTRRPVGQFAPWAVLSMPDLTRAYRFVFPILLVAGWNSAYMWDVRTGILVQKIESLQLLGLNSVIIPNKFLGALRYVELSDRHVFVCGTEALSVFSRSTGKPHFHLLSDQRSYGRWAYFLLASDRSSTNFELAKEAFTVMDPGHLGPLTNEFAAGKYRAAKIESN